MRISDWSSDVCSSDLGAIAQLGERLHGMQEVGGSIPPGSTICFNECCWTRYTSPSSRGLGHHPFTVDTGVRIPVGTPSIRPQGLPQGGPCQIGRAHVCTPVTHEQLVCRLLLEIKQKSNNH